jgi:hypothetical protein
MDNGYWRLSPSEGVTLIVMHVRLLKIRLTIS